MDKDLYMRIAPLNPMDDGTCRTIKSQYQRHSLANFIRIDGLAATGVIEYDNNGGYSEDNTGRVL